MHRVTYAPGDQGSVTRYSVAYLIRPHGEASMKRLSPPRYPGSIVPQIKAGDNPDTEMNAREWEEYRIGMIKSTLR